MRSDAQRRQTKVLRNTLQEVQEATAEREGILAALRDRAGLLEQQEQALHQEGEELRQQLEATQQAVQQSASAHQDAVQAQAELAAAKTSIVALSQRCSEAEQETGQLRKLNQQLRERIQAFQDEDQRKASEIDRLRRTKKKYLEELDAAEGVYRRLTLERDDLRQEVKLLKSAPSLRPLIAQPTDEVIKLRNLSAEVRQENAALSSQLKELNVTLQKTKQERTLLEESEERLQKELAETRASLHKWQSEEISRIGVATAKAAGQVGLGYVLAKFRNSWEIEEEESAFATPVQAVSTAASRIAPTAHLVTPSPATPVCPAAAAMASPASAPVTPVGPSQSAAPPSERPTQPPTLLSAAPQQTEEERKWRERIRSAEAKGWRSVGDYLVDIKRRALTTRGGLPPQTDLEYLAIRAAIEARREYYRQYISQWEIEDFKLDLRSELHLQTQMGIALRSARDRVLAMRAGKRR